MRFRLSGRSSRPPLSDRQGLKDFNRSLVLIVDPEALQASVAARVQELTGAGRLIILQLDADKQRLTPTFSVGAEQEAVAGLSFRRRGRLARWLLTNEACLVIPRAPGVAASLEETERRTLARLDIQVCVPLVSLNRLIGLILLGSGRSAWSLDADRIDLLQLMASQAGLAFENALLNREQRDRLRRLDRAERLAVAGQLAAGVAHEIRNPLTSIRSTVQYLLQDYSKDNPKRVFVEEVLSEVDRIDRTVGGLLSLTRAHEIEWSEVDLADLLDQTLVLVTAQAQRQGVAIGREPWDPSVAVRGDSMQLKQVCLNLLLNALQAMPDGGTLTVSLGRERSSLSDDGLIRALVRIADTGIGIPREHMDEVFDPFFTTKREGTGLGLSVSYWIVQRHDGELDLTSEPGRGTTVSVRLPVASVDGMR
jgi:two-component system, NtrC family, sensor kinase